MILIGFGNSGHLFGLKGSNIKKLSFQIPFRFITIFYCFFTRKRKFQGGHTGVPRLLQRLGIGTHLIRLFQE